MDRAEADQAGPLAALRRHWIVAVVLTLLGALAGAAAGYLTPTTYTAEARVAVGSTDLSALAIPGYALGSQQLAGNIARYVSQSGAQTAVQSTLGGSADSVTAITASPIPSSNIIRVEATAADPATARAAADAAAQYLTSQSATVNGGSDTEALLGAYTDLSQQLAAQGASRDAAKAALEALPPGDPGIPAATQAYVDAQAKYDTLDAQQGAANSAYQSAAENQAKSYKLVVVTPAADSYDTATSSIERYGLIGVVVGFLLALVSTSLVSRRRTSRGPRTRTPQFAPAELPGDRDDDVR